MYDHLQVYRQSREALLVTIVDALASDERFVAAWLTGSYARGEADAVSDIDLTVVVADACSESLCQWAEMTTAHPVAERLTLFSQFGHPANVHENNHNAPEGGTFTSVLYQPSAHIVDWILVPYSKARRPEVSQILFKRAPIAPTPPLTPIDPAALAAQVAERIAFIWMMIAVVTKFLIRGDLGLVRCWIDELNLLVLNVARLMADPPDEYRKGPRSLPLTTTAGDLAKALVDLNHKVENLMIVAGGMNIPLRPFPKQAIDVLFKLIRSE